jgi:hypothetical protein
MAFRPVNYEEGKTVLLPAKASIAFVKGNALVDDGAGFITNGASSTAVDVNYIADETVTSSGTDGATLVRCIPTRGIRFNADCDAAPAQTDVGTLADLGAAGNVNPDASSNDLFFIESIDLSGGAVGTTTKVFGYFQHANEA